MPDKKCTKQFPVSFKVFKDLMKCWEGVHIANSITHLGAITTISFYAPSGLLVSTQTLTTKDDIIMLIEFTSCGQLPKVYKPINPIDMPNSMECAIARMLAMLPDAEANSGI